MGECVREMEKYRVMFCREGEKLGGQLLKILVCENILAEVLDLLCRSGYRVVVASSFGTSGDNSVKSGVHDQGAGRYLGAPISHDHTEKSPSCPGPFGAKYEQIMR